MAKERHPSIKPFTPVPQIRVMSSNSLTEDIKAVQDNDVESLNDDS